MKQKYGENPGSNKYLYSTLNGDGLVRAPVATRGSGSSLPSSLTFRLTSILLTASEKDLEKRIEETVCEDRAIHQKQGGFHPARQCHAQNQVSPKKDKRLQRGNVDAMLETALFALTGFFGTESPIIAAGMITAIPLHYLTSKGIELSTFLMNFVDTPRTGRHRSFEEGMKMVKSLAGLLIANSAAVTIFILMVSMARDLAQGSYWEKFGDFSALHLAITASFTGLYFAFMACGMKKRAREENSYGRTNLRYLLMMLVSWIPAYS